MNDGPGIVEGRECMMSRRRCCGILTYHNRTSDSLGNRYGLAEGTYIASTTEEVLLYARTYRTIVFICLIESF